MKKNEVFFSGRIDLFDSGMTQQRIQNTLNFYSLVNSISWEFFRKAFFCKTSFKIVVDEVTNRDEFVLDGCPFSFLIDDDQSVEPIILMKDGNKRATRQLFKMDVGKKYFEFINEFYGEDVFILGDK